MIKLIKTSTKLNKLQQEQRGPQCSMFLERIVDLAIDKQ